MTSYQTIDDQQLVLLIRSGNHDAFAELVTRHTDRFFGLAYRTLQNQSDAEDVVQAAFVKFWEQPHLWKPGKALFTTWFYRVILNACHDHFRKAARTSYVETAQLEEKAGATGSEQSGLEDKERSAQRKAYLEAGMRQLPDSQRDALNLVVYCELSQQQAADIMGVSVKAIESLLIRAKRSLSESVAVMQAQEQRREVNHVR